MAQKSLPKLDLYKLHKADYAAARKPALVNIAPATYLAIRGRGAPGGPAFCNCIGALYAVAFTIKMTRKFSGLQDYAVCKLEAQWFMPPGKDFKDVPKDHWEWRLLIRTPDFIGAKDLADTVPTLLKRGKSEPVTEVKLEIIEEGHCAQILHVGPYDREPESIALLRDFAAQQGWEIAGPHHEIYLSDPRRVAPERLRTILREPLKPRVE